MRARGCVAIAASIVLAGCGGGGRAASRGSRVAATPHAHLVTAGDPLIALLPDGAQLVLEIDLARLRANPVVGELATHALAGDDLHLPAGVPASPLRDARTLVLAAYAVGTAEAATVILLATDAPVANARVVAPGIVALATPDWLDQVAARAAIANVRPSEELLALRDRAMPAAAPGAIVRATARLSFDARVSLARTAGLESAPAQVSLWADVVDDAVLIVDADAADPGDKETAKTAKAFVPIVRGALASLASERALRAIGVARSIEEARVVVAGRWVRAIIAVGPAHLKRVVARMRDEANGVPSTP